MDALVQVVYIQVSTCPGPRDMVSILIKTGVIDITSPDSGAGTYLVFQWMARWETVSKWHLCVIYPGACAD